MNRNDLVAAKSLFNFAATRDSDDKPAGTRGRKLLRADNPVVGVKLVPAKEQARRSKVFKADEACAILILARAVEIDPYVTGSVLEVSGGELLVDWLFESHAGVSPAGFLRACFT